MSESLAPQLAELLAQALPGSPVLGLRARKKASAMRRIQEVAVEQFEEHGFAAVTIEQIAEHAEVSPSSVYRYFGTKERLVLHDEYDDLVFAVAERLFADHDPWTALGTAIGLLQGTHFVADGLSLRRMRVWQDTASVRAEGFLFLDESRAAAGTLMHAGDRFGRSKEDYEVVAAALMAALFRALERWYADGATSDLAAEVVTAIEVVRPAWAPLAAAVP